MLAPYATHDLIEAGLHMIFNFHAMQMNMAAAPLRFAGFDNLARPFEATARMSERAAKTYTKPSFGLPTTRIGDEDVTVTEHIALAKPYGNLVHFERNTNRNDPKVLLCIPMSGHYATLLRGTVEELLPHHDVYITDWANARDVPKSDGGFGLDDYTRYIQDFIREIGPDTHVIAVCQPTVPVLAATALMAAKNDPLQPLSLTVMGGPIDTRAAPTAVTRLAEEHPIEWFRDKLLATVPAGYKGAGQKVYPGFVQLTAFMAMNPDRHVQSHMDMYRDLLKGDFVSAGKKEAFYDEYLAVQDMSAQFYIETVDKVFKQHQLAKGTLVIDNQKVDLSLIRKTALFTVEGEKDDISAPGQTSAAHTLCNNIPPDRHFHYLQPGVGHYGIFEGKRWAAEICPRVSAFIRQTGAENGLAYSASPSNIGLLPPGLWPVVPKLGYLRLLA